MAVEEGASIYPKKPDAATDREYHFGRADLSQGPGLVY